MVSTELPKHIGIIMDGNGRWATSRKLPRNSGHERGAEVLKEIAQHAYERGVEHLTVFAFSTENVKRPKDEVDGILNLMRSYLKDQKKNRNKDAKISFLGKIHELPDDIKRDISKLEKASEHNTKFHFNIAFNYGGREDILQAAKKMAKLYKQGVVTNIDDFSEEDFSKLLYTQEQPDMDLLIRTSGEMRISNFLIWQSAYAELIVSPVLWPDYTSRDFDEALEIFRKRNRRMGGL